MPRNRRPRHGSLAFYPKKRAKRIYPTVKHVKLSAENKMGVFAGYKAGMINVVATELYDKSPNYGQQVVVPCTVIECPPLVVFGIRVYEKTVFGLKIISQILADKFDKNLAKKLTLPKKQNKEESKKKIETKLESPLEFRVLVHTQPKKIKLKKTPEVFEVVLTGKNNQETWKYAQGILGKEINVNELFKENEIVDVTAITRGKGTQGPVKRFGIKIQPRKAAPHRRFPGAVGAWTPSRVLWTVPQRGQLGFQRRTELNKKIIKIGADGKEVTPSGGFVKYGIASGDYMLIKGSVPGPRKRLVLIRHGLRKTTPMPLPEVKIINLDPQQ